MVMPGRPFAWTCRTTTLLPLLLLLLPLLLLLLTLLRLLLRQLILLLPLLLISLKQLIPPPFACLFYVWAPLGNLRRKIVDPEHIFI